MSDYRDNSSDHFPIYVNPTVPGVKNGSKNYTRASTQNRTFIDWNNSDLRMAYQTKLSSLAENINPPPDISESSTEEQIQSYLDDCCTSINDTMLDASESAADEMTRNNRNRPKGKWW